MARTDAIFSKEIISKRDCDSKIHYMLQFIDHEPCRIYDELLGSPYQSLRPMVFGIFWGICDLLYMSMRKSSRANRNPSTSHQRQFLLWRLVLSHHTDDEPSRLKWQSYATSRTYRVLPPLSPPPPSLPHPSHHFTLFVDPPPPRRHPYSLSSSLPPRPLPSGIGENGERNGTRRLGWQGFEERQQPIGR
jgi:hypothetical protein